ncbi:hypothetical protein EOM39_03615, partial [Candidatus Gracilibacteria bacterium]|nr:hypothetical protein [Candidatus Gracilibacteria bacterium]
VKPLVKVSEVKTEPVVKPLVKVAEVKTEPVVKPLVKVVEEKNEHVTLQVKLSEEKNESVIEQVKVLEVKQEPVKPLIRVPLEKPLQRVPLARHDSANPLVKTPEVIHEVTVNEVQKKEIENIAEVKIEEKDKSVNESPVEIKTEAIENKVEEIKKDIVQEVSNEKKETAIDLEKPKDLVENVQKNDETIKVEQKQEEKIIEKPKTEISSIVPEVSNNLVLENQQKQDFTAENVKIEPIDDSKNIADKEIQTNTEIIDSKIQDTSTKSSIEKSVSEDSSFDLSDYKDENITPIKAKNRKIKVLFSPKNIDSLIKTKQFREELEEIFRRIINNLESKHIKNLKQTKSDKIKELEKVKSILLSVISNKNISVKDKELVEHFLEDVLNHNSFYRKEIINALDNIEIVHPLKMLGFGGKVSLVKDVIEGKEINALIGNILSRIDNLIVYKRFEKRKIQKYYFAGEQDSKVNKIIHEFFNGNYFELADLAYKIRNEIDNYDENRQIFTKIVEKFVKDEEKYRDKLKNIKLKNLYTLSIIFDQIINPRYDMDAKMIYLETFNSKKKLIY